MRTTFNVYEISALVGDTHHKVKIAASNKSDALASFQRLYGQPTSEPYIEFKLTLPKRDIAASTRNANRIAKLECLGGYRPIIHNASRFHR